MKPHSQAHKAIKELDPRLEGILRDAFNKFTADNTDVETEIKICSCLHEVYKGYKDKPWIWEELSGLYRQLRDTED